MVTTNTELAICFLEEDNYAGGFTGGAAYSETVCPTTLTTYTRMNYLAGDVKLGAMKYKRNRVKAPGIGLGKGLMVTTGVEFPDIEFSYYIQGAETDFGDDAVGMTEGTIGTSYTFNVTVPDPSGTSTSVFTVYGAQLKSYKIEGTMDNDKPPFVTVTFSAYSIKEEGIAATGIPTLPVTAVSEWEDMAVEIDTVPITELKSFSMEIKITYVEVGSGRNSTYAKFSPLLKDKELTFKIEFYKEEGVILNDLITAVINDDVGCELITENETFLITNCYMSENNFPEYKGDDIAEVEYSVTYKNADSAFSRA